MPRDTLTALLILPLACTSDGSRTSTIRALPRPIKVRASAGVTRGMAALASASISLTLDGMTQLLSAREGAILAPEPIARQPAHTLSNIRDHSPAPRGGLTHSACACCRSL